MKHPPGAPASWNHRLVTLGDDDYDPEENPTLSTVWLTQYTSPRWDRPLSLVRSKGHTCLWRLASRRCPNSFGWDDKCLWLGADHYALWLCGGRPYSITAQPCGVQEDQNDDLRAKAGALGLEVRYSSASWHYPGSTVLVEIRRREMPVPAIAIDQAVRRG